MGCRYILLLSVLVVVAHGAVADGLRLSIPAPHHRDGGLQPVASFLHEGNLEPRLERDCALRKRHEVAIFSVQVRQRNRKTMFGKALHQLLNFRSLNSFQSPLDFRMNIVQIAHSFSFILNAWKRPQVYTQITKVPYCCQILTTVGHRYKI